MGGAGGGGGEREAFINANKGFVGRRSVRPVPVGSGLDDNFFLQPLHAHRDFVTAKVAGECDAMP
jgi:hypothetical protein